MGSFYPTGAQQRKGGFQVTSEGPRRMHHQSESLPKCKDVGHLKNKTEAPSLHLQVSLHGDNPQPAKST